MSGTSKMTIFSASGFVDQIVEQYLSRINKISPKDVALREEIVREIRFRLVSLSTHLRAHVIEEARLHRTVLHLLSTNKTCPERSTGTNFTSLSAITEAEKAWYRAMAKRLEEVNRAIGDRALRRRKEQETAKAEIDRLNDKISSFQLQTYSNVKQQQFMEMALKKQDVQLAGFIKQRKDMEPYVQIARNDAVQALEAMKPYMTWYYLYKVKDDAPLEEKLSGMLTDQLALLLEQIDRYKSRMKETSDRVEDLERGVKECFAMLGAHASDATDVSSLKVALRETLDENARRRAELEDTAKKLSGQILQRNRNASLAASERVGADEYSTEPLEKTRTRAGGREEGGTRHDEVPNRSPRSEDCARHAENPFDLDRSASSRAARPREKNSKRKSLPHLPSKSNSSRNLISAGSARAKPEATSTSSDEHCDERTAKKRQQKTKLPFSVALRK